MSVSLKNSNLYQLVLKFPYDDLHDYDWMIKLEDALEDLLVLDSEIDGHDAGSGEMNIFIRTAVPELTFGKISKLLEPHAEHLKAAYRDFSTAKTDEDWIILFPPGLQKFSIV